MGVGHRKYIFIIGAFAFVSVAFQNCGQVRFSSSQSTPQNETTAGTAGGGTTPTIEEFQPAVAIRDTTCIACHANIQSNLITDFGYGDSWYMNGFNNPTNFGGYHYVATTWQTINQLNGQVIIPDATVNASYVNSQLQTTATPLSSDISLEKYLTLSTINNFGTYWNNFFNVPNPAANPSFTYSVNSGTKPAVVTESNIYIGAPTTAEILALAPNDNSAQPFVQVLGNPSTGLNNLTEATGVNNEPYFTNSGNLNCSGKDVVVNGTLVLNSLQLFAENEGCRLYVTGPVFIEGPVTYLNSGATVDPTDNLQITSATAILMGVGLNGEAENGDGTPDGPYDATTQSNTVLPPLEVRLLYDVRGNMVLRQAPNASAYQTFANSIYAQGENIGLPLLQDASVPGNLPTGISAAGQTRASINFQHILLNAPLIHSRYLGTVQGVIVAESAVFSLGEFSFQYDPVFESVPVLPALKYDILCTGSPCNPADP